MIIGTAGHIDHGKTTLVRALTGVDTDRLPEEKRRGITIDLGFAPLDLPVGRVGVVDVPGHEAFVRTMLAGATGIDAALLVIAADEGIMPQTREHLAILGLLGVHGGVVALTKCDTVDAEWRALVEEDVRAALKGTSLASAAIVHTSAPTGEGIDALRDALDVVLRALPTRDAGDMFRLPVDRAFTVRGTGTVVTGTVWTGSVERDDSVRVFLPGVEAPIVTRVRGVQAHGEAASRANPGARVALSLANVEVQQLSRGATVIAGAEWVASSTWRADVALLEAAPTLGPRTRVRLHLGTAEVGARLVVAEGALAAGTRRSARVVLDAPLGARAGDRFVLRLASPVMTIGGGVVTDPVSPRRAKPLPLGAGESERLLELVRDGARNGLAVTELRQRLGVKAGSEAHGGPGLELVNGRLFQAGLLVQLQNELVRAVEGRHAASPLEPGAPLQELRGSLGASPSLVDEVARRAVGAGRLELEGSLVRVAGWAPRLSSDHESALARILARLESGGAEPPSVDELSVESPGVPVRDLLRLLERRGEAVQVEADRYYTPTHLESLVNRLRSALADGAVHAPGEIREALGLSRKFLIPFLEHCDRRGLTHRTDTGRSWRGT
ncbi:MAG: selenocysteine-specific translation elongation factor [Gemmatimonadetes bacterium]|nr:selenocysteine-specific translation elongation factor [Gemmatimonadota bacterium]